MKRKIVSIDRDKCNGCGACADACHEGAIAMVDGKAELISDVYCDGLGDCLPACPADAITITEREADAYSEAAVARKKQQGAIPHHQCPGSMSRSLRQNSAPSLQQGPANSQLRNWPVQLRLAPVQAPYFDGARLLIAADCTAYAHASFHDTFMQGRTTLIGCPKLDPVDYTEKLTAIFQQNDIQDVTVVRMQVPCCGGLERAVINAIQNSGKALPCQVIVLSPEGTIVRV